jgi:hypothetical protein
MFFRRKRPKQKTIKIVVSTDAYDAMVALAQTHPLYRRTPDRIATLLFGDMLRHMAGSRYGRSPRRLTGRWTVKTRTQYAEADREISDTGHDPTMRRFIDHILEQAIEHIGDTLVLSVAGRIVLFSEIEKDTELFDLPVHVEQQLLDQLKWLARVDIFDNTTIQRSVIVVWHQQSLYDISISFIPPSNETTRQSATFRAQPHTEDLPTGWGA